MEIILWRHADAEDGADDMARGLTAKGEAQAAAMARWLRRHVPRGTVVLASPARRAQQTAAALGVTVHTEAQLAPGASVKKILEACERQRGPVIVVGHQPDLGRAAAHLVGLQLRAQRGEWSIEKGAIWWIDGPRIKAVLSPDLL